MWDPASVPAPTGVVTFLFTDIEGSTRRWESDADAMRDALAVHDHVLRTAIEAHDGFLFKHTGDGVVAAFASPRGAVEAAVEAQRGLDLPVRMGIATGESAHQDGDYFGAVLNRAARVMAAGHGGQILIADSTAALISGLDLVDLGPRRLRDVPNPVTLFQVRAAGLGEGFPPLRALDTNPGNLQPAGTPMIGRGSDVAEVEAAVRAHRLVTLTGVGGVGKTRLAMETARRIRDEFPDGVWLFELAAVADPVAVTDAVAAVLGITRQPGKTQAESVAAALDGRVRLLVFDNCEHVLDAAAELIEMMLRHTETVKVLATSRETLGVADEQVWRVRSLNLEEATDLFVARARSVTQGFSEAETDVIGEICARLDGIPLAVELAASRMAAMTATEVRDHLDDRFRLLVGARRGLERHQTLRHAVQWSYDLLDEEERKLLARCSVFAGGFDIESACAIAGSDDIFATIDLLDALVRKSLVTADRSSGRTRYGMLETIRQYAEERLADSGAAAEARTAHARYFAGLCDPIIERWDGPRDLDTAAVMATTGGWLGGLVENYEPVMWAEELVAPARDVGHPRLASLCGIASLCFLSGRVDEALEYSRIGQVALDADPRQVHCAAKHYWLGAVYSAMPISDRYVAFFHERRERDDDRLGLADAFLSVALTWSGRTDDALSIASGLPALAEASDNPFIASYALLCYGMACSAHEPLLALDALRRALLDHMSSAVGNFYDSGNITQLRASFGLLATFLGRRGEAEQAATLAGFAGVLPTAAPAVPEFRATVGELRAVLGDQAYESRARTGAAMTMASAVAYAYDQIDRARAGLDALP